jgi:iron complex outermembrane receptor protein
MSPWRLLVVALQILVFVPRASSGQVGQVTLSIAVKDSTGAAIPGATIRIVHEKSGAEADGITDAQGRFQADLTPGPYRVETALDGFDQVVRRLALEGGQLPTVDVTLNPTRLAESIVVRARRVEELAQEVPIPVSVINGALLADSGAFNVNRLKELVPTVQFYSTNPRNSAINIRGLGAPFGLTNDGIDPGVGFYVDGVFHSRPAAATLDFIDLEQTEVLRGPQGTLPST